MRKRHGMSGTRIYHIWDGMKNRCTNLNHEKYPRYGGRGITVCAEWQDNFTAFAAWALANGYADDLTIDREDNDGDYSPDNCRWVTRRVNNQNRPDSAKITAFGETKSIAEWLADSRCQVKNYDTLHHRVRHGWESQRAIMTPPTPQKRAPRKSLLLTAFGETKMLADWLLDPRCRAENYDILRKRIRDYGWEGEKAISTPPERRRTTAAASAITVNPKRSLAVKSVSRFFGKVAGWLAGRGGPRPSGAK